MTPPRGRCVTECVRGCLCRYVHSQGCGCVCVRSVGTCRSVAWGCMREGESTRTYPVRGQESGQLAKASLLGVWGIPDVPDKRMNGRADRSQSLTTCQLCDFGPVTFLLGALASSSAVPTSESQC